MNKLIAFGFLVSLIVFLTEASLLVVEEGTPNGVDWRQLRVELPPATFDVNGDISFEKPIWTRVEGAMTMTFAVLGSLTCPDAATQSVAALIDGTWVCLDINDPALPPNTTRRHARQTDPNLDRVSPPATCAWDEAPLLYNVSHGMWQCVNPDRALIQYVRNPPRPICNDTDLVVYNEDENWFECKALSKIQFLSTISKVDNRWQVPSTTRHIGSIASTGKVRSGDYTNFRWSLYVFQASTESLAYDQTSPPQVVTSGGVNWLAYTISTTFVAISGSGPYYHTAFNPIYPGTISAYNNNITKAVPGSIIRGESLVFQPSVVTFNPSGSNTVSKAAGNFTYNAPTAGTSGGLVVVPLANVTVDAGGYPVIEILPDNSNWYVGSTPDYNPNLILTLAMWLQYSAQSGF